MTTKIMAVKQGAILCPEHTSYPVQKINCPHRHIPIVHFPDMLARYRCPERERVEEEILCRRYLERDGLFLPVEMLLP